MNVSRYFSSSTNPLGYPRVWREYKKLTGDTFEWLYLTVTERHNMNRWRWHSSSSLQWFWHFISTLYLCVSWMIKIRPGLLSYYQNDLTFVRDRIPDVRYNQSERGGAYKLWEFTILWWNWNDHLWQMKIFREERPCEEDPDGDYDFMVCVKNSQAEWHLL